jgi:CBS domain containing-hemolysin-like protein
VHFVPETDHWDRIFLYFFERYQHLFVVVDKYGSVTGVISLEEIVDESNKARDLRELAFIRKNKLHTL